MSLLSIAVEQREKEAQTLNSFLAFSLIGSLALHAGVLGLGIGKFLSKAPEPDNEPLEIAIVELPNPQKLELEPEKANGSTARNDRAILSSSGGSEGFGAVSSGGASQQKSSPQKIASSNSSEVIKAQPAPQKSSQTISKAIPTPPQNQKITLEKMPAVVTQSKPVVASARTAPAKPVVAPLQATSEIATQPKPVVTPPTVDRSSQIQQLNNQRLNGLLANAKNAREPSKVNNSTAISDRQGKIAANLRNQTGSGVLTSNRGVNSAGNESKSNSAGTGNVATVGNGGTSNGTSRGTGNITGTSNNNGTGKGNNRLQNGSTVATGARNTERRISPAESDSNPNPGSSSGRLACRSCSKPKYPERARRRGIEGKAEISVDVDSKGNVTKVRLARTSGHSELDKAALEQARDWKFKAPNGAAQGVTAKVEFAIEGSKKSRQIRERRRQRAAARKQPVASSQNPQPTPVAKTPANTDSNRSIGRPATTRRRRVDTLPPRQAFDQPQRQRRQPSVSQTRLRESLRRSPRASSPNQTRTNQTRIRRSQPTSSNQTKLRQSLRLHQQKSPLTPSTTSNGQ